MRHLHALIIASGLFVPSLAFAAAPVEQGQLDRGQGTLASHAALQAAPSRGVVQQASPDTRRADAQADRARYAEKQAKSPDAKNYRGGDTVVIGASAATAILAVILLVVLI